MSGYHHLNPLHCDQDSPLIGADSWNANPWVWVVEFKRIQLEDKP